MKRVFLLSVVVLSCFFAKAQTVNGTAIADIDTEFLEIIATSKMFSKKITITVDFGQKTKFFSANIKETVIKDSDGKPLKFNSVVDALNFFSRNGYEFINAFPITTQNQKVYHYLMKKK